MCLIQPTKLRYVERTTKPIFVYKIVRNFKEDICYKSPFYDKDYRIGIKYYSPLEYFYIDKGSLFERSFEKIERGLHSFSNIRGIIQYSLNTGFLITPSTRILRCIIPERSTIYENTNTFEVASNYLIPIEDISKTKFLNRLDAQLKLCLEFKEILNNA